MKAVIIFKAMWAFARPSFASHCFNATLPVSFVELSSGPHSYHLWSEW